MREAGIGPLGRTRSFSLWKVDFEPRGPDGEGELGLKVGRNEDTPEATTAGADDTGFRAGSAAGGVTAGEALGALFSVAGEERGEPVGFL